MLKTTKTTKNQSYNCPGTNHLLKPVKVAVYDIPQLTDERWNELAEQNKMLHNDRIIVSQIKQLIGSVAAEEGGIQCL